jgi:hypothetical protein
MSEPRALAPLLPEEGWRFGNGVVGDDRSPFEYFAGKFAVFLLFGFRSSSSVVKI